MSTSSCWLAWGGWIPHVDYISGIIIESIGRQHAVKAGHVRFAGGLLRSLSQDSCIESSFVLVDRKIMR